MGSLPRASASSKVVVRGLPRVSGNNNVSTPIINARIPTMSYTGVSMNLVNNYTIIVKMFFVGRILV